VLTEAAKAAARELHDAGVALAITSGRPPRGMSMLIEPLALQGAIAGFNGGVFVNPDLTVIESHTLDPAIDQHTLKLILDRGLDAWVYTEDEWLIRHKDAPHVACEAWTVKFDAKVVASFTDAHLAHAVKIVGISDDLDLVAACEKVVQNTLGEKASATLAAVLSRRDPPASQQGSGRGNPVQASEHSARADCHHGGTCRMTSSCFARRLFHRRGQLQRRGEGARERGDRQ
jgi:hydroxymethylpyrimidine pyrophosphatase-like HAD family hydrolase